MVLTFTVAVMICLFFVKIYEKISKEQFNGYGYLKLASIGGIWFSLPAFLVFLFLSALLSLIFRKTTLPVAAAISLSFIILIYFPELPYIILQES